MAKNRRQHRLSGYSSAMRQDSDATPKLAINKPCDLWYNSIADSLKGVLTNMITKLEKPVQMTTDEAQEKFYPNSYVMVNCVWENGCIISGEVFAYAPMKNNGGQLSRLSSELTRSGEYGDVKLSNTKDPLDGGSLLVEYCEVE